MTFWTAATAIVWKDLRSEWRTKDIFSSMFVFALLSVIIFNFAFELRVPSMAMVAPGILWVAVSFAGTLGLNRAFVIEQDKGSLAGLLLAPVDRGLDLLRQDDRQPHLHAARRERFSCPWS